MTSFAWRLGLRSIPQHKRRNFATLLAIGFGYMALILICGYNVRVNNYMTASTIFLQNSGHIAIFQDDGLRKRFVRPKAYSLKSNDVTQLNRYLATLPQFDFAVPYLIGNGLVGNGCSSFPFVGRGFDPRSEAKVRTHPMALSIISEQKSVLAGAPIWANPGEVHQVSLGRGLAAKLGKSKVFESEATGDSAPLDCEDPQTKAIQAKDRNLQFVGLTFDKRLAAEDADISSLFSTGFSVTEDLAVQAPLRFMQSLLDTESISYLAVFLEPADLGKKELDELVAKIDKDLSAKGLKVDVYAWNDARFNPEYVDGLAVLRVTVGFVAIIILFVVLLSIINTLSIGLAESRRDIGTLRAIGYNPSAVAKIYTIEVFLITVVSVALSAILSYGVTQFIASLNIPFQLPGLSNATSFQLTPTVSDYLLCAGGVITLVLLVTYFTARKYAKQGVLFLLDPGE